MGLERLVEDSRLRGATMNGNDKGGVDHDDRWDTLGRYRNGDGSVWIRLFQYTIHRHVSNRLLFLSDLSCRDAGGRRHGLVGPRLRSHPTEP